MEQVLKTLKLAAYADPLPLQCDRIHVLMALIFLDGTFTKEKVLQQPSVSILGLMLRHRNTGCALPSELLGPEDIPALQEYLGYCLIPSTKGQKCSC